MSEPKGAMIFPAMGMAGLTKPLLSFFIGMAAAAGFLFHAKADILKTPLIWAGVSLVAMAGALVNNLQDRTRDPHFSRTKWRGESIDKIGPLGLFIVSILAASLGLSLMVFFGGWLSFGLTLSGLVLYNGLYTPLKRLTPFALFPGALCGMAALLSGWTAAGGALLDIRALSAALVVGLWQFPHAMVQTMREAEELRKHEESSLPKGFDNFQLTLLALCWTLLYNLSLYHLVFMAGFGEISLVLLFLNAGLLTPLFTHLLFVRREPSPAFHLLNFSLLLTLIALMAA